MCRKTIWFINSIVLEWPDTAFGPYGYAVLNFFVLGTDYSSCARNSIFFPFLFPSTAQPSLADASFLSFSVRFISSYSFAFLPLFISYYLYPLPSSLLSLLRRP
jgi:hypothetical protein